MMSSTNSEDDAIRQLLSTTSQAAALPDAAFLAELRERTAAEFVVTGISAEKTSIEMSGGAFVRQPGRDEIGADHLSDLGSVGELVYRHTLQVESRWQPWGIGLAALAMLAMVWLIGVAPSREATLADVLASVNQTSGLRMRVEAAGASREVQTASGGRIRWDVEDGKYAIGRDGRLWQVDEAANRAASREAAEVANGRVDVVAMLVSQASDETQPRSLYRASWRERATWMTARANEVINRDGREFRVYRAALDASRPKMRIEAVADASGNRLQSLRLTEDRDGREELLAAATVLAWDVPVEPTRFVVRESLTEDGRIGKVTKHQGIVTLQPVVRIAQGLAVDLQSARWTPICEETMLRLGDWVRTDAHGANAVAVKLSSGTDVILGPGTLAEFVSPTEMRLDSGEAEITVPDRSPVKRHPVALRKGLPGAQQGNDEQGDNRSANRADGGERGFRVVSNLGQNVSHGVTELRSGTHVVRVDSQREPGKLIELKHSPAWLLGFKGALSQESLGSLIAKIDGRNVPLSVGYHKVTVDIRDQIARTVIEESFFNHTDLRTEGTFFFPLPADASISGFGMWIGNELVEADIVEKQRARDIFETILREKRDPGLLEWAGGNVFKARVFPIEARSEKRVKITYTQVLPSRGRRFRYSYALQSELLKQHPLRDLSIDVTVASAVPLRSVKSPTHLTRDELTPRAARVRFAAQNHTPTRDFEVVVETEQPPSDVVLIPHRRADDGYFLLQFTPPGSEGDWERELLPSNEPMSLLILADTSGSMDDSQRKSQAEFIAGLLASLSPRDTFNLATCDVTCDWAFESPRAVGADDVAAARSFLAKRRSLGWTNFRAAVESVCRMGTLARPRLAGEARDVKEAETKRKGDEGRRVHVIYLGDGIVTTGAKTPEEFANALPRIVQDAIESELPNLKSEIRDGTSQISNLKSQISNENKDQSQQTASTPQLSTLNSRPSTLNSRPSTLNSRPSTLNSRPSTLDTRPSTLDPRHSTLNPQLTFHAVAIGSTFEWSVLKAFGAIGGGSVRRLSGEQTPIKTARELLTEIASPSLRDVKLEFNGLTTMSVYPESLPNLPLGMQQNVLGKYVPKRPISNLTSHISDLKSDRSNFKTQISNLKSDGSSLQSEPSELKSEILNVTSEIEDQPAVIVTGSLNGKPVRLTAPIQLADDESGNSFIPRLWARQHLDHLLKQGPSEAVKNDVIAMSEEFHIITPYTSLLVLESDADRERFGVKRRFQMRDGEKFFAAGRDNANYALVQKQMQRAALWRQQLRNKAVSQLSSLGRDIPLRPQTPRIPVPADHFNFSEHDVGRLRFGLGVRGDLSGGTDFVYRVGQPYDELQDARHLEILSRAKQPDLEFWYLKRSGPVYSDQLFDFLSLGDEVRSVDFEVKFVDQTYPDLSPNMPLSSFHRPEPMVDGPGPGLLPMINGIAPTFDQKEMYLGSPVLLSGSVVNHTEEQYLNRQVRFDLPALASNEFMGELAGSTLGLPADEVIPLWAGDSVMADKRFLLNHNGVEFDSDSDGGINVTWMDEDFGVTNGGFMLPSGGGGALGGFGFAGRSRPYRGVNPIRPFPSGVELLSAFPRLSPVPLCPESVKTRGDVGKLWEATRRVMRPKPTRWSDEAWALAESVLRTKTWLGHEAGLEVHRVAEAYDVRWQEWTRKSERIAIATPRGWLVRSSGDDVATETEWCDESERGIVSAAFELGWVRRANVVDVALPPLVLEDFSLGVGSLTGLVEPHRYHMASVEQAAPGRKVLSLRSKDATQVTRVEIDTARHVVLSYEVRRNEQLESKLVFKEFVAAAGSWWPTRIEQLDSEGRLVSATTQTVKSIALAEAEKRIAAELTVREGCLVLQSELPRVGEALKRIVSHPDRANGIRALSTEGGVPDGRLPWAGISPALPTEPQNARQPVGSNILQLDSNERQQTRRGQSETATAVDRRPGFDRQQNERPEGAKQRHVVDDYLVVAIHYANFQQWERAWKHLDSAEQSAAGQRGFRWIRDALLNISRRHEELLQRLHDESKRLATAVKEHKSRERLAYGDGDLERLAAHVISVAGNIAEADERLLIVDRLRPIFERQEPRRQGLKTWREHRHRLFASAGQSDEATELLRLMASTYRHDLALQQSYAQQLMNLGDRQGAADWLRIQLKPDTGWTRAEEWQIRFTLAQWMQSDGRFRELERWLIESLERLPTAEGYRMYLETLRKLERAAEIDELVLKWLSEGIQSLPDLTHPTRGLMPQPSALDRSIRLGVALKFIGDGHGWTNEGVLPAYRQPLFDAVMAMLRRGDQVVNANSILGLERFRKSPEGRRVLDQLVPYLRENVGQMESDHALRLLAWITTLGEVHQRDRVKEVRESVRTELRKRWEVADDPEDKDRAATHLLSYLGGYSTPEMVRQFRRELLRTAHPEFHEAYAAALFNDLLGISDLKHVGTPKLNSRVEAELFDLVLVLGPHKHEAQASGDKETSLDALRRAWSNATPFDDSGRTTLANEVIAARQLLARIEGYQRLQSTLLARRLEAILKRTMPEPNKLKPDEQTRRREQALREARTNVLTRLTGFTKRANGEFAEWLRYEQLLLLVDLGRELDRVVTECWSSIEGLGKTRDDAPIVPLTGLRVRHLSLLTGLVSQGKAEEEQAERLVAWLERRVDEAPKSLEWKVRLQTLLLALDRPKDLERHLTAWSIAAGEAFDFRWHVALAYLKAELGRLPEAIGLLEQVEQDGLLSATEYRALAMWYQAVDRRPDHERALVQAFQTAEEGRLAQQLSQLVNPWHNGRLPSDVNPNLIRMFQAVFMKSAAPQNYLWQLQRVYQASHDFRLLSMLPDVVIGHTAAKAFPFLSSLSGVLSEIRDEATADELIARLAAVRTIRQERANDGTNGTDGTNQRREAADAATAEAHSPHVSQQDRASVVDHRALDFLELQVERRAAELLNQPGPHIDRALAALRRAFDRGDWSASEPRHYADMLAGLGQISQKTLADEQIRQLRVLFDQAERGGFDRLRIGQRLAERLWDSEPRRVATELLLGVLDEFLSARGGVLSNRGTEAFGLAVSYLNQQQQFVAAERLCQSQLDRVRTDGVRLFVLRQWLEVHRAAFSARGETSLGKGLEHYERLQRRLIELAETKDATQQVAAFESLAALFHLACDTSRLGKSAERAHADLDAFATKRLRELMARPANHFQNTISTFAHTIRMVSGPRAAIAFVLDWADGEPTWLKHQNQSGVWEYFRSTLAQWRRDTETVGGLGDVEPRLLERVLASLRHELLGHNAHHYDFYRPGSDNFWKVKSDEFARVASEVAAEKKTDVAVINFVAAYLNDSLGRSGEAIDILTTALKSKVLGEEGRSRLARYLMETAKHGEAIPILTALMKEQPNNIDYRTWLMSAYFHTQQPAKVRELLARTDQHFHKVGWGEGATRALAEACLGCELFAESVAYWKETIAAHEQSQPRRGIGNGTLSYYYSQQASAYAGLKDSPRAVDAAVAAIVSWGVRHEERKQALTALHNVIRQSPDLTAIATHYDTLGDESKLDNPIVRKALGQVFLELKRPADAIPQLRLAIELQPHDLETHDALIASFDAVNDKQAAADQLLDSTKLNRRDLARFKSLGARFVQLGQPAAAERAFTNIVESLPLESESHALLAEVRETQDRWPEAITHWRLAAELRALEPEPLLRLAAALIQEKQNEAAEPILRKLETTSWEQRFGNVTGRTRELRGRLKN